MEQLPPTRLQPGHAFSSVSVDYICGLTIHQKGRGNRTLKVYICVFVCNSTKAIHLEVVGDLSTAAFIAALRRMIGRRGLCHNLYCDNGTNFVGASNELKKLRDLCLANQHQAHITSFCKENQINVQFCPPKGPHFNGLAESGVGSFKRHYHRIVGNAHLTYEELNTITIQIEAVLNSRPMTAMSADPHDLEPLTPGHFLIGRPLTSFPEPDDDWKYSYTQQYHRLRQLVQHFWQRWSKEYLNNLQQRHKWNQNVKNLVKGQLVLVKEDNLPPLMWTIGRIVDTIQGNDGIVRVVTIRTKTGTYDRPVVKVCPLPIQDPNDKST